MTTAPGLTKSGATNAGRPMAATRMSAVLATLPQSLTRPPKAVLDEIMRQYREGQVEAAAGGG